AFSKAIVDREVLALDETTVSKAVLELRTERRVQAASRPLRRETCRDDADPAKSLGLLCLGGERRAEGHGYARDESPSIHYSITRSARASTDGGMVIPNVLAVFRLTMSVNFAGCSMGMSAGFVPRSTLSTCDADLRKTSTMSAPYCRSPPA